MKNKSLKEIVVAVALIIIVVLLLNPFYFYMPNMMFVSLLVLALVSFGFFASFILREEKGDERESVHRTIAGRSAFLVGSGLAIIGILVQSCTHTIDPWLVIVFSSMIITKIVSRMWSDRDL